MMVDVNIRQSFLLNRTRMSDPSHDVGSAQKGLDYMYANFEFVDRDGNATPFGEAMNGTATVTGRSLKSVKVQGNGKSSSSYEVPYDGVWHPSQPKPPTSSLKGAALTKQLDKWASTGIIERDAADAVQWTADYVQKESLADAHFVLIGAGSAMGPCAKLLELGANVVAIDIPGSWGKGHRWLLGRPELQLRGHRQLDGACLQRRDW